MSLALPCPECGGLPATGFSDEYDARGQHFTADAEEPCRVCHGTGVQQCEGGCGPAVVERIITDAVGTRLMAMCPSCVAEDDEARCRLTAHRNGAHEARRGGVDVECPLCGGERPVFSETAVGVAVHVGLALAAVVTWSVR